jgi:hypothetical protein
MNTDGHGLKNRSINSFKFDATVRSRHTRESAHPGIENMIEKTGFPFARE